MGMCSRQERIQKDIDIVIQKCKAEKDCLFAGEFDSRCSWFFLDAPHSRAHEMLSGVCVVVFWGGLLVSPPPPNGITILC